MGGGGGGSKRWQFNRGGGVASRVFFWVAPSKIEEQAISFTVNRCFICGRLSVFSRLGR